MKQTIDQRMSALELRVTKLESSATVVRNTNTDTLASSKKMSAREFLLTKVFKSELEKTLILAYYLEHVEKISSFGVSDVIGMFQAAKEKMPVNPNDAVAKNVARGFLMDAAEKKNGKKAWTLTATGERYVENELNR